VTVVGVGLDLVDVEGLAAQLADPASAFADGVFTAGERRAARAGAGGEARHLAGRWAAKEAFVKAWSAARRDRPPQLGALDLREVEVVADGYGRPALALHGAVAAAVAALAGELGAGDLRTHLSLSHDGGMAAAVVVLEAPA
jgi:holo-[acyl-carrier protein] synthase